MNSENASHALEAFFKGSRTDYTSWKLPDSKRDFRVLTVHDAPWPNCRTHISFEAHHIEWDGVRKNVRLIPVIPAEADSDPDNDASFHAAWLLDRAIANGVPPTPGKIVLTLGHDADRLPHVRYDYPFPWEKVKPAEIAINDYTLIPVLAYSVSDREAEFQNEHGKHALNAHLEQSKTPLFDRRRVCSFKE